jgi:hypothetical protein
MTDAAAPLSKKRVPGAPPLELVEHAARARRRGRPLGSKNKPKGWVPPPKPPRVPRVPAPRKPPTPEQKLAAAARKRARYREACSGPDAAEFMAYKTLTSRIWYHLHGGRERVRLNHGCAERPQSDADREARAIVAAELAQIFVSRKPKHVHGPRTTAGEDPLLVQKAADA